MHEFRHLSLLKGETQLETEGLVSAVNLNFWSEKLGLEGREGEKKCLLHVEFSYWQWNPSRILIGVLS